MKKLLSLLLLWSSLASGANFGALSPSTYTLFQVGASDSFQRANAGFTTPWVLTPQGTSPFAFAGTFSVVSNAATVSNFATGDDNWAYSTLSPPGNQWVAVRLGTVASGPVTSGFGVSLRTSVTGQNMYRVVCDGAGYEVISIINGADSTLSSGGTPACATGHILGMSAVGSTLQAFYDWKPFWTGTDTNFATGKLGISYSTNPGSGTLTQWFGGTYNITGTSPPPPTGTIKFHAGQYAASQAFTTPGNPQLAQKQGEITTLRGSPSIVLGIMEQYYWRVLENTTAGVYDFSAIDRDYVQTVTGSTSWVPGNTFPGYSSPRRFAIYIFNEDFFHANPTTNNLPDYLVNSATYGPLGPDGVHYGYWTTNGSGGSGTGSGAALWRPAVMNRLIALGRALAAHVLPDGTTVDTSPYVEVIGMYAETAQLPNPSTDSTWSIANSLTQFEALDTAMGPLGSGVAFPHTIVMAVNNYLADTNSTASYAYSFPSSGTAAGASDVFGQSSGTNSCAGLCGLTWGQLASSGYGSPGGGTAAPWSVGGGTNLRGVIPITQEIQSTELGFDVFYEPLDIFNQLNNQIKATHAFWTINPPGQFSGSQVDGNWWGSASSQSQWSTNPAGFGGVLYTATTSVLSATACPSAYTGGCNIH